MKEILNSSDPQILFQNSDILIAYKPSNLLSVRSRFHKENPLPNLVDLLSDKTKLDLLPVHRLDYEVAGLTLLAKNKDSQRQLSTYFEKRLIKKTYQALTIESDLQLFPKLPFEIEKINLQKTTRFEWTSKILRGKKRSYASPSGDKAVTQASYLGSEKIQSFKLHKWELHPLTGRSHQLRFEMARHSHPILGDELYFAPLAPSYKKGIALIATKIDFSNCSNYQSLGLSADFLLDIDWNSILEQLVMKIEESIAEKASKPSRA